MEGKMVKVIIPVGRKEHEVEINPDDYTVACWKVGSWRPYEAVCEGFIESVKNPKAEVPEVIKQVMKALGSAAFYTRDECFLKFCKGGKSVKKKSKRLKRG